MNLETLTTHLWVFLLASFVGLEIIKRVSPLLHTPLMSLTNAISAISVVGAILVAGKTHQGGGSTLATALGTIAVTCSTINIVGGYLITYRMLSMFKSEKRGQR